MDLSLISTEMDWAALKEEWDGLLKRSITQVPFLLWDYQHAWWQTRGGGEWPKDSTHLHIVVAREQGQLVGIAPLFVSQPQGHPPTLHFIGQVEVSDYLDFIIPRDYLSTFTEQLLIFLAGVPNLEGFSLQLDNLLEGSPSREALKQAASTMKWEHRDEILQPSPYIPTAPDWEQYLARLDKKQRHEIRRKMRNASTMHECEWYLIESGVNCGEEMQAFMRMMRHDPNKDAFLNQQMVIFMEAAAMAACHNGILHLAFLKMDGENAGAYFSFINGDKLLVYNSAWNPKFSQSSPGWVLLAYMIQWAIEHGFSEVDMMRGNEGYKYKFGGIDRHVLGVTLKPA